MSVHRPRAYQGVNFIAGEEYSVCVYVCVYARVCMLFSSILLSYREEYKG